VTDKRTDGHRMTATAALMHSIARQKRQSEICIFSEYRSNFCLRLSFRLRFLPRDAMHKRGLCRHAVFVRPSVCLSVCLSRSWIMSKRINISSKFFSPSVSHTILVFSCQTGWQYSDGNPLTGASNAGSAYAEIAILV